MLRKIVKKTEGDEEFFKCTKCGYKSKKEVTLKKHMLSKHEDHTCKECKKKFKSFMVLLKHVTEDHFKEEIVQN